MKSAPDLIVDTVRSVLGDWSDQPILLGCSGGMDSMVLARALLEVAWPFEVAHVDYGLRPDSIADRELVMEWSLEHDIPCHVLSAEPRPGAGSVQAWARDVRYRFFAQTAAQRGLKGVVVAHHADDQAETVALAQMRGSGVDGLAGMACVSPLPVPAAFSIVLLRPLLCADRATIDRATIERAAEVWGVTYRTDASNVDMRFRRAAVRRDMTEQKKRDLLHVARASQEQADAWWTDLPESLRRALNRNEPGAAHACRIPIDALRGLPRDYRAWYLLRLAASLHAAAPRRRSWVEAVHGLMSRPPGAQLSVGVLRGVRDRDALFLYTAAFDERMRSSTQCVSIDPAVLVDGPVSLVFGAGLCRISRGPWKGGAVCLDIESLSGSLLLRRWQPGDRFLPLGASGSTKIKDFLVGAGVAPSMKPYVPVFADETGIVCVPGHRAAERFRIPDRSKTVLRVEWVPGSAYFPVAP